MYIYRKNGSCCAQKEEKGGTGAWRCALFAQKEPGIYDYCGTMYDEALGTALNNGSPACPACVEKEEKARAEDT